MTMSNPTLPTNPPESRDSARYTARQEREMGVTDDKGHKLQPSGAFVMIALTYVFVAAVAVAVVAIILHYTGAGSTPSSM